MISRDEARRRLEGGVRSNDKRGRRRGHCEIKTDYSGVAHYWLGVASITENGKTSLSLQKCSYT